MLEVKSLYIIVPEERCINNCAYCIYEMQGQRTGNCLNDNAPNYHLCQADYAKRLTFARENGCNALTITGQCEPQQNKDFLRKIGLVNQGLKDPFPIVDIQTTGSMLDRDYLYFLRMGVGVTTVTLQIAAFQDTINQKIIDMPHNYKVELEKLCREISDMGFILRLSIHLTEYFNIYRDIPAQLLRDAKGKFCAHQVVLRSLIAVGNATQAEWIRTHSAAPDTVEILKNYVRVNGRQLNKLESGTYRYAIMGISVVVDSQHEAGTYSGRNASPVLRANGHLYDRWDEEGSLIF